MKALAVLAEDLVQQVRGAVHDKMLLIEFERRVHIAGQLDDPQSVQRAMDVPHRTQDCFRAILRGGVTLLHGEAGSEFASGVTHLPGGEELGASADAQVQISGTYPLKIDAQAFRCLLWSHVEESFWQMMDASISQ